MDESSRNNKGPIRDELTVIPNNLKLRLEKCPKCGYERQGGDTDFFSPYECPRCGVLYAAAMEEIRKADKGHELLAEEEVDKLNKARSAIDNRHAAGRQSGGALYVARSNSHAGLIVLGVLLCVAAVVYFIM